MRVNNPARVNGPPLVNVQNVILPRKLRCQVVSEVVKMSKNAVTYDDVFRFLSNKNKRYAEGCTDSRNSFFDVRVF